MIFSSTVPSAVRGLKAIRNVDGSVTITWNSPAAKGGPDLVYHIVINGKNGFYSKGSNYSLLRQEKRHQYTISVSLFCVQCELFQYPTIMSLKESNYV